METAALHVLLVEDSPIDRALVERLFRDPAPLPGPIVLEVASDADGALAAVRANTFSVILMDYSLPGLNGLELLRRLRDSHDQTPVVMITGSGDEEVAVAALQCGAADYVVKQIGFERTLPVVIERVLQRHALEVEVERARKQVADYARQLERQVEDQTHKLRHTLQESEGLRRVGRTLAASRELRPALDLVSRTAGELLQAQAAAVMIRSGPEVVLASTWGALKHAPGLKRTDLPAHVAADWQETAVASLGEGDREIGLLWLGRSRPQRFSTRELEVLGSLADMTAMAITNVRAHEQLRRRVPEPGDARVEPVVVAPCVPAAPQSSTGAPRSSAVDAARLAVPPFPPALARLVALAEEDDPSSEEVEETVRLDSALASRAIHLASAPALGRARPVNTLREALLVLGLRTIRNLAFASFARDLGHDAVAAKLLWENALATAIGTQLVIATREPAVAEDAYLCGLLHNVGDVAINSGHPDLYERVLHLAVDDDRPFADAEREALGYPCASVTQQMIARWSLPARVARTLAKWEPGASDGGTIAVALGWAQAFARTINPVWRQLRGDRPDPAWMTAAVEAAASRLALAPDVLAELQRQTIARGAVLRGLVV